MNAFQRFWTGLFGGSTEDPSRQLAVFVDEVCATGEPAIFPGLAV